MKKRFSMLIALALLLNVPAMTMITSRTVSAADTIIETNSISTETSADTEEMIAELDTIDAEDGTTDDISSDDSLAAARIINFEDFNTIALKETTADPKIINKNLKKDILQNDSHILNLKNVTSNMSVSFKSSDSDILTVKKISNSSCKYTGVATGTAQIIISITIDNGFFLFDEHQTLKTSIDVTPHAASIKFQAQTRNLTVGQSRTLKMIIRPSISKEVPEFESSNPKVASVNAKGRVSAKKAGSTFITATIANGKSAKCRINVAEETE